MNYIDYEHYLLYHDKLEMLNNVENMTYFIIGLILGYFLAN